MGSTFSTANSLYVHLDKPFYFPGDVVNGQVLLNCINPFAANVLVLKVEGEERTDWTERRQDGNNTSHWHHSGSREFFKVKVPLQSYPAYVQPGQYQFPFSFVLPMGVPASFELSHGTFFYRGYFVDGLKAKIRYEVKAECEVPGMLTANIKHKAVAVVRQRLEGRPASQVVMQDRKNIKTCCCVNKGSVSMTAHVDRDSYLAGEVAVVVLEINNESSAEFKSVDLLLKRVLKLRSNGAGYVEIEDKMASVSLSGIRGGESHSGAAARRLELPLPGDLQATARGQLISCEYFLECKLKASALTSNMYVKLPITIYQAPPADCPQYTQPPPGWQPGMVYPPVQVQLPAAPPLPPMPQQMMAHAPAPAAYIPPAPYQPPGAYQPPQPMYSAPQ